jgi:hypothetical protein
MAQCAICAGVEVALADGRLLDLGALRKTTPATI